MKTVKQWKRVGRRIETKYGISYSMYQNIHYWMKKNFGKAGKCENENCSGKSTKYGWALKIGYIYEKNRENFVMLCSSCHSKQDTTEFQRKKMSKLWKGATREYHYVPIIVEKNGIKTRYPSIKSFLEESGLKRSSVKDVLYGKNKTLFGNKISYAN